MLDAWVARAGRDPKVSEALGALIPVFFKPDIEARVWCDDPGEVAVIKDTIESVLESLEPVADSYNKEIARIKSVAFDEPRAVWMIELSNGSAIVLGCKCFVRLYR